MPAPRSAASSSATPASRHSEPQARRAAQLCADNKARDVVLMDLAGVTDMTDFFVVASGTSDTHVRSTAEHVMASLAKEGLKATHVEGLTQGRWVLLDYTDFVVHLFHPTLRSYYQLERLWSDATVETVDSQGATS